MSFPLPLEPETLVGGHYIIKNLINRGGFGAVYRGVDTSEGNRPCAIKETYDVTPAARRQALMEAGLLFTVKSRHLPQVYDAFETNGRFYLVMQLIEGQNLLQVLKIRGGPCAEQEVLSWLFPIMRILQGLHSRSPAIIHRDIKPGNIILTRDGTAVLVDFGLTKLYDPGSETQTKVRAVSEGFSPFEQYVGKTSPQSDIYSLAATMYFLLTGITPPSAVNRSLHDELTSPRMLNPLLSPKLERVLLKALSVYLDQRYQSMREFAQALQEPGFNAYADPTVQAVGAPSGGLPANPYAGGQSPPAFRVPSVPYPVPPPQSYVSLPPPPGYVLVPQSTLLQSPPLPQTLPSSFGQGCLWGLLQGTFAALLLLFLKKEAFFFVGIAVGFLFYFLAGFRTTREGGRSRRGGWAGFWAGIISTLIFWVTFILGVLLLVSQQVQADTVKARQNGIALQPDKEFNHALHAVMPLLTVNSTAPSLASLLVFFGGGLVLATALGWLGGILGKARYKASLARRKHP